MSESGNHVAPNPASEKPQFPEGLRVLAVDDNVVCLKVIAALLIKCRFVATVTTKATEALEMLRKNKESYDIVITDVEMPDMNGFKLLEIVGLEMDMPVIMMSASDDTKTVMKGIKHGARDYLTKPVRLADVKTIWKHAIKKNVHDPIKLGNIEEKKDEHPEPSKTKKQRGTKGKEEETNAQCDEATYRNKKPRLIWSTELHYKFVDVFQQIGSEQGIDKAVPKKILERMNDPRLTRENVASHLQKFRNTLKREGEKIAKMNEENEKNNTVLSKAIVHLPNPTTVSTGIPSFGTQSQTFGAFRANNRRPLFYNPANQHNILLQQNVIPRPVADQKRSNMHIPAPIFSQNSCSETELDWMRFHSNIPRTNMVNNHSTDSTSHFPGFNTGPTTMPNVSYSCPPSGGAFNLAGVPLHGSTQLNHIPQPESQVQSSTYGQYEGTNLVNFNGRGETNGHFVQHPFENSENESNGVYNNYNYPDDDLSYIIRQFSSNPPPRL